jgi:hypothetical protein
MSLSRPIVVALCVLIAAGCSRRSHEIREAFQWEDELSAGSTIHLRNTNGEIQGASRAGKRARVVGSKRWSKGRENALHFMWTRAGNDVYVCAIWGTKGQCDAQGYRGGRIRRSWLDMFSIFRRSSTDATATLTVELPRGIKVDAVTSNGAVHIDGATNGITAQTANGSIDIAHSAGATIAITVNGSVRVSLDSIGPRDGLRLQTINGSVTAAVPSDLDGEVDLQTVNGRVQTDFPIAVTGTSSDRTLHGRIGASSREVVLKTINGGVSLLKRPGAPNAGVAPATAASSRS